MTTLLITIVLLLSIGSLLSASLVRRDGYGRRSLPRPVSSWDDDATPFSQRS